MPNRRVHTLAGVGSAWLSGYYLAPKDLSPSDRILFALGLTLGGWLGSRMPDVLDPPISPAHRSYAHGSIAIVSVAAGKWLAWMRSCCTRAKELRAEADLCQDSVQALGKRNKADGYVLLAGAMIGFGMGYSSHLVLDAFTPKGLPPLG